MSAFERYHIETEDVPDIVPWPSRFKVKVGKMGLTRLLLRELVQYRGDMATGSEPALLYMVSFREALEVIHRARNIASAACAAPYSIPNSSRCVLIRKETSLGDSFFDVHYVNAIAYEASTGSVPVKGAGYGGKFGGQGWDGMWTDMSEIVRPTRDGIHGREYISTVS